jgi:hypothetical protein
LVVLVICWRDSFTLCGVVTVQYYKLSKEELDIGSVVDAVVTRIAARDCQ